MRKLILVIGFIFSSLTQAQVLPDGWSDLYHGVTVHESDFGEYVGIEKVKIYEWHAFKKVFVGKESTNTCVFYVHPEKLYVADAYSGCYRTYH